MNKEKLSFLTDLVINICQWGLIIITFLFVIASCSHNNIQEVKACSIAGVVEEFENAYVEGVQEQQELAEQKQQEEMLEIERKKAEDRFNIVDMNYTEEELRYMSAIIWAEARGESIEGQKAVGIVVMNRKESAEWPDSIYEVIYQKGQFQPVSNGQMNKGLSHFDNGTIEESVKEAAAYALQGNKTINWGSDLDMSWAIYFNSHTASANFVIGGHQFK